MSERTDALKYRILCDLVVAPISSAPKEWVKFEFKTYRPSGTYKSSEAMLDAALNDVIKRMK